MTGCKDKKIFLHSGESLEIKWDFSFDCIGSECKKWPECEYLKPEGRILQKRALAKDVLVVAVQGAVGDWSAYIGAVPGINHEAEKDRVAREGEKLPENLARMIFPGIASDYKWRG